MQPSETIRITLLAAAAILVAVTAIVIVKGVGKTYHWGVVVHWGIKGRATPTCYSASSKNPFSCPFERPRINATNYEYRTLVPCQSGFVG